MSNFASNSGILNHQPSVLAQAHNMSAAPVYLTQPIYNSVVMNTNPGEQQNNEDYEKSLYVNSLDSGTTHAEPVGSDGSKMTALDVLNRTLNQEETLKLLSSPSRYQVTRECLEF